MYTDFQNNRIHFFIKDLMEKMLKGILIKNYQRNKRTGSTGPSLNPYESFGILPKSSIE